MSKIKVNELETAIPTLNDTLLGSNATKEYSCKVEDLASLVGGGVLILTEVQQDDDTVLDHTWQEIWDALESGQTAWIRSISDVPEMPLRPVVYIGLDSSNYTVTSIHDADLYIAATSDDYPVLQVG